MVQRVVVHLVDDIDGEPAQETVTFGLDGVSYEIDLTDERATELRGALEPWKSAARRVGGRVSVKSAASRGASSSGANPGEIRAWANANGFTVSERGRVPAEVRTAYENAH